jgi:hypothetical protein
VVAIALVFVPAAMEQHGQWPSRHIVPTTRGPLAACTETSSCAGHWPTTVRCQLGAPPDPCNEIHNPAVVPGEVASVLYAGWSHGVDEPDGTYVFKHTIHGSLNGTAVALTASSPPISMTR